MGHVGSHVAEPVINDHHERGLQNRDEVERLLSGLPPQEAEIVRRYHLGGESYREISHDLGVPENSIGPTLSRARARLQERAVRS
jgi:RNA polymerase sigma-70 factor (ECF subfamily)